MAEDSWTQSRVGRIGDMHPLKALTIHQNKDGDIVLSICINGMPLGGLVGDENATLEFCSMAGGGGRSTHTRKALLALMEAIKKDNEERPDAKPENLSS